MLRIILFIVSFNLSFQKLADQEITSKLKFTISIGNEET